MRLQSAIEFLSTYGWAIIILTIVLAVLFVSGFFNTGTYFTHATCTIPGGFGCTVLSMNTIGILKVNFVQSSSDAINLTSYTCNQNASLKNFQIPNNGPVYLPIGANYTISVQCYNNLNSNFNAMLGTPFSGLLIVNYTDAVTGLRTTLDGKIVADVDAK